MKRKLYVVLICIFSVCTFGFVRLIAEDENEGVNILADDITIDATNFPDANFLSVVNGFDTNKDGALSLSERNAVTSLVVANKSINSLQGVEYFTQITVLYCNLNNLTSLDLSSNTLLKEVYCDRNKITSLNLSGLYNLQKLECHTNQLTSLDVSNFSKLWSLYCFGNPNLNVLDISNCVALQEIQVSDCNLDTLSLPNASGLRKLTVNNNNISTLNIQGFSALTDLYVAQNPIAAIDVSNMPALENLVCFDTLITSLDLSNKPKLRSLQCYNSNITSLNLSDSPVLDLLHCYNNKISDIQFPATCSSQGLKFLCDRNALSKLNLPSYLLISYADRDVNTFSRDPFGNATTQVLNASLVKSGSRFVFDLGSIIGMDNIDKVTMSDVSILNTTTGKITYDSLPTTAQYAYDTGGRTVSGNALLMNVTVNLEAPSLPSYSVVFKDYDDRVIDTQSISEGGKAKAPADPTRNGYTFTGWNHTFDNVRADLEIKAQYSINTYKINYLLNTGTNHPSNPSSYTVESETIILKAPTRKGFVFKGWTYNGIVDPVKDVEIVKGSTGNKSFMAIWDFEKYTVKFETDGGSAIASEVVDYGAIVKKPNNPIKDGYTFVGWFKDVDFNEPWDFQKNTVSEDMSLYAKWLKPEEGNHIVGIVNNEVHVVEDDISFEAIGYGLDNTNPLIDDIRFVPYSWSINPSGVWDSAPYKAEFTITKPGEYLLKVIFHKEIFDGVNWVYIGEDELKTSKVIIKDKKPSTTEEQNKDKEITVDTGVKFNYEIDLILLLMSALLILKISKHKTK